MFLIGETMKWTREIPKISGIYWYREKDGSTYIIELDDDLMTGTMSKACEVAEWWGIVAWFGPIQPPKFDL